MKNNYKYPELDGIVKKIIGGAIEVHKILGPGLLESSYQKCLVYELKERGLTIQSEIAMPLLYKKIELDQGYRMDILVDNKIVLELKATEGLSKLHQAQLLTYLRLGNYPLGLLLNFNSVLMKDGIKRMVL